MPEILMLKCDTDLEEAVYLALGAASVCWETPEGAGVFDSTRAKQIGAELIQWLRIKTWN